MKCQWLMRKKLGKVQEEYQDIPKYKKFDDLYDNVHIDEEKGPSLRPPDDENQNSPCTM
jgi:hypothetical protein